MTGPTIDPPPPHVVAYMDQVGEGMKRADPFTDPDWQRHMPVNPEAQKAADEWLDTQLRKFL